jgi:integrase
MTPFRAKNRKVWKTRITLPSGETGIFSCGTDDLATARQVVNAVKSLKRRRIWAPLEAVVRKQITLGKMFDAYESGTLDNLLKELNDPDLSELINDWTTNDAYRMQVRRMIPKGERYPASRFTRKAVSEFLANLNQSPRKKDEPARAMSGSTKNRYRAALSVFARWLVEREVIETNPVRDVRQHAPNPPRMTWLTREQAKKLLEALPPENRAMEALMAATGLELGAVRELRRKDVSLELKTVRASGTKTPWRSRVCIATEAWAWTMVESFARNVLPDSYLFTVRGDTLLKVHQRTSKELGLPATTLHDWRHSYAVWSLKDGISETAVAQQLGHKDTSLLRKIYGRYIPDEADFSKRISTPEATRTGKVRPIRKARNA